MNFLQKRQREMSLAVSVFCQQFGELIPEDSPVWALRDQIDTIRTELQDHSINQFSGIGESRIRTANKTKARRALRTNLKRIIESARFIARTVPEFDEPFKFPQSQGDAALLYTARKISELAAASSAMFLRFALPANFIDELNGTIGALEAAAADRAVSRSRHRNATTGIDGSLRKAMDIVTELDIILSNLLRDNGPALHSWKSCRRIKGLPRRKKRAAAEEATGAT